MTSTPPAAVPIICTFKSSLRAFCVTPHQAFRERLGRLWPVDAMGWEFFERGGPALERLFSEPPDLLLVDWDVADPSGLELVRLVKSENIYRRLPVMLCLSREQMTRELSWCQVEADDFIIRPLPGEGGDGGDDGEGGLGRTATEYYDTLAASRISLCLNRSARNLDTNPLTRLPGNTTIIQQIQSRIDAEADFALAYADLDNFKAYNDRYGFSRGDEVLMMTARVIMNTIRSLPDVDSFLGHVGGDDFVFILPPDLAETACKRIVESFDAIVPNFYDQEDRDRGGIQSTDRQGAPQLFGVMAISIAVVFNRGGRLSHYGEVSHLAAGLKKKAKRTPGSSYLLDRRT